MEILNSYGYNIDSHVSRFGDMLKQKLPGLELQNIRKKLTLFFKSTADALISDSINDSNEYYQTLLDTALPLRQIEKTFNNLDDCYQYRTSKFNSYSSIDFI